MDVFSHLETKFQQIGRSEDSVNNDDWFYFPMGDNDGNRAEMQQIMLMGSYEGCIVQAHFYEVGSSWYLQRQVLTVDTIVDATSEAQRVTWNTKKSLSLSFSNEYLIPCDNQKLYYHPFGRFFFYYLNLKKVIILDRGFTTSTGDACTVTETPTAVSTSNSSTISNAQFLTDPAFYDSQYTYIGLDHSNGWSYIYRWNAAMDAAGSVTNNDFTNIHSVVGNIRDLYGMQDVGLFFVLSGSNGYYICKITTSDGTKASVASYETSKSWSIFQAPFNLPTDIRPVYLTDTSEPHKFYKGTNVLTEHFVGTGTQYDFFSYPARFGRYYAMQIRPGTCAEEGTGSEDYDKLHVNVLSIRDKAHSYCIDDSEDIYCGNGKWEDYNLEECDDGDNSNGDGCSSACVVETRWVCTQVVNATSTCTYDACGNGYLDSGAPYNEECDDGNTDDGDGCSSTCTIEDCYYCSGTGTSNSCTLQCENSVLNSNTYWQGTPKTEVCDEGPSKTDALGCLECCSKIQAEYKCTTPGTECILRCGDGVLDQNTDNGSTYENCDDGNTDSGDGCQNDCTFIEDGYKCLTAGSPCELICGDGIIQPSDAALNNRYGNHFDETCEYNSGNPIYSDTGIIDVHGVCCTNCLVDQTRSIVKSMNLNFSYVEFDREDTLPQVGTTTSITHDVNSDNTYCVPLCKSMYKQGKEWPDSWVSHANVTDYPTTYNKKFADRKTDDQTLDLTKYIEIVDDFYIDPTTRVCFEGKFCWDCLQPKFPGYEVENDPDTDAAIMAHSRGNLRIIEADATNYGFSYVTNQKTELQFSTGTWDTTIAHNVAGASRQSFDNYYIQTTASLTNTHDIYVMHDGTGSMNFEKIFTTTEGFKSHVGYDRYVWWPTKNFFLARQYDQITWDGFGLNANSVAVSTAPTTHMPPEERFEPFSTGPISIDGDLNLDAVYSDDMLVLFRENTMDGNNYLSFYSWTPGHFKKEQEHQITSTNEMTSMVSFGSDGVLVWHKTETTGTLYQPDGTVVSSIAVEITTSSHATTWTGLASKDLRLIQARPSPTNPAQNPTVYAYFTEVDLFSVTLDVANTKIVLADEATFDARYKLYQPIDIGHVYLATMQVLPCTMPTTDTDIYATGSVHFYELGSSGATIQCIDISTAETIFN